MNKIKFISLIRTIDNVVLSVANTGELKGRTYQRRLNSKDDIEKEDCMCSEYTYENDINNYRQHIRNMLTDFMNKKEGEDNE
jgi:hypothetical protein